jgi:hypothetical protein
MSVRRLLIVTGTATVLAVAPLTAAGAAPGSGGCKAFGQSVSTLANTVFPKGEFGANASFVASTLGPKAFPTVIVKPEQDIACPG